MRPAQQVELLAKVLMILLADDYAATEWQPWLEGAPSADPPRQITDSQIHVPSLHQLTLAHLPALQSLHRHNLFDEAGCLQMAFTMNRLAEAEAAVGAEAGDGDTGLCSCLETSC